MTRLRAFGALLLMLIGAAVVYAQEPLILGRALDVVGYLRLGAATSLIFEGSTNDASETTVTAADPTADRTWTIPNAASDTFVGLATTDTLTNKTFTQPAITELSETVTATNVLTAAESGKTFYLSAVAGFLTTLPTPAAGLHYRLVVKTAPTSNGYTIGTPTADILFGMVEERAGTAGVACASEDLLTLVANQSIVGDWLEIRSDGTNWYVHGMTDIAAGFTCTVT